MDEEKEKPSTSCSSAFDNESFEGIKSKAEEVGGTAEEAPEKAHQFSLNDESQRERKLDHPTSEGETLVHLLKGNIGSGSLALPEAFLYSGLYVGLVGIPIIGVICLHCMQMILRCSRNLCKRTGAVGLNYEETAKISFKRGPNPLPKFASAFHSTIMVFLVITQLGFCCVYFVFVSQNMYQAVECISGGTSLTQFDYMVITLVPIILVCYIPDLKYLAPVSFLASFIQALGYVFIFYYLVRDFPEAEMDVPAFAGFSNLPLYFGSALYAFEGIGLVLPLENNMKKPETFPGWNGVLNTGMVIVICLYSALGFFGYLRYGDTVLGSITLNLPGDEALAQTVKIMMSFAIFMTYPLQFYVPLVIMTPGVVRRFSSKKAKLFADYLFRTFLVLVTFAFAALIPNIGLFVNLIGAICSSTLALIFPPIIDTATFWPKKGKYNYRIIKNVCIGLVGLLGFATGAYTSLSALATFFQEGDEGIALNC